MLERTSRFRGHPGALLVDCDSVILDWLAGFTSYAEERLGRSLDVSTQDDFDMSNWLGTTSEQTVRLIMDFNEGDAGVFRNLPAIPGAVAALTAAHGAGREIHVITACSINPDVIAMRRDNLVRVFGDIFSEIHCVDMKASKRPILAQYHASTWVEDKFENAVMGAESGHRSYLFRMPYNAKHAATPVPGLTWVDGWSEVVALDT